MSGPKLRQQTIWREALAGRGVQQSFWALRLHAKLTVTVKRRSPETAEVTALVTRRASFADAILPTPIVWTVLASNARADAEKIDAAVAVAKAWAETQADNAAAGASR